MSSIASGTKIACVAGEMVAVIVTPSGNASLFVIRVFSASSVSFSNPCSVPMRSAMSEDKPTSTFAFENFKEELSVLVKKGEGVA